MANQFLSLGLFVMLLSFFIVLNSMSNFEVSKSRAVIESVTEAFITKNPGQPDYRSQKIAPIAQSTAEGSGMDRIDALFKSTIPGAKTRKNRLGNVMSVQIPRKDFEAALYGALPSKDASFRGQFIKMLISLIRTRSGIAYEMDILLNVPQNPSAYMAKKPDEAARNITLAASYTNKLEQAGLNRKYMSAGLTKGNADKITLTFRHYVPMKMELSQ